MTELTPKRRRFCQEYVLDSNGTAAAIRAGFSDRTAKSQASQMLDMPAVKEEIERLQKAAADARNITLDKLYLKLEEACQIARRKESASGMVAAVTALAKLSGLWIDQVDDLALRAKMEAEAAEASQRTELKTAGQLLADAAESYGLPRDASPAMIVGAIAERPIATPAVFALLHAQATKQ
ncbi:terminase small subunit [Bradyrhizobium ottawaense]|uniref:terminase small subunit n=1 Tax=Bradyrhizobium ottawaense TaxID=931866 RepID=UPI001BAC704A|nr:terminase small subunit [Bradyrhizobium ottawaense]MBR1362940.1 terminase small subunit [Bradyrhizobium ottawaense]